METRAAKRKRSESECEENNVRTNNKRPKVVLNRIDVKRCNEVVTSHKPNSAKRDTNEQKKVSKLKLKQIPYY